MLNENQRLDYLHQLGVVSWMPRQPLPGAQPSAYFYHEAPVAESPFGRRKRPADPVTASDASVTAARSASPVAADTGVQINRPSPASAIQLGGSPETPAVKIETTSPAEPDPMDLVAHSHKVNRVPESLQLVFIRPQGDGPLIISHFGEQGDSEQRFLPLVQSMLEFVGENTQLISLPFVWPLAGMPAVCREQEFVQVFRALLGGARLGCKPGQACWWFGELPELIAEAEGLLDIRMQHEASLTQVMAQSQEKQKVLYALIPHKKAVAAEQP